MYNRQHKIISSGTHEYVNRMPFIGQWQYCNSLFNEATFCYLPRAVNVAPIEAMMMAAKPPH